MYKLHKSSIDDLPKIAACHQACFANSLSSKLGKAYAAKSLEWFLVNEHRFLYHISFDNVVIGYCGGFSPRFIGDGSTSGMLQHSMQKAFIGILKKPWLIFHPELLKFYPLISRNIYKKLLPSKKGTGAQQKNVVVEKKLGLVVIGVHPKFRGKKIFEQLMIAFEKEAYDRDIFRLYLSVKKSNERAVNAYRKAGWSISLEHQDFLEMSKYLMKQLNLVDEKLLVSSNLLRREQDVEVSDTTKAL